MATSFESRSCISLPRPSLSSSLKSASSMTPLRSLASASLPMILLILSPISLSPLSAHHVGEAAALGHLDERVGLAGVLVRDVLHEEQRQDVVLVLRGVHAAAQFVAALPEGAVELGFLEGHGSTLVGQGRGSAGLSIASCLTCGKGHRTCSAEVWRHMCVRPANE